MTVRLIIKTILLAIFLNLFVTLLSDSWINNLNQIQAVKRCYQTFFLDFKM